VQHPSGRRWQPCDGNRRVGPLLGGLPEREEAFQLWIFKQLVIIIFFFIFLFVFALFIEPDKLSIHS